MGRVRMPAPPLVIDAGRDFRIWADGLSENEAAVAIRILALRLSPFRLARLARWLLSLCRLEDWGAVAGAELRVLRDLTEPAMRPGIDRSAACLARAVEGRNV